ncbi:MULTISPECIES: hypothetical protein [unclassified Bradyrhizobium]|uniref:hypothetical protein n=1 Tax=unclassified Bradyrhizobium TaxID=2631580 RepID=UPI001FF473C1|nr:MULTISPECIES: hypothetical protein [unclassified Bradyrhizobium]MCJ9702274.1 hypothetical protein [Bradyrhizobium sp. SHOUNA76]MCJ9735340.1 hypothetical protein [Bradyrhizobium sp. PRIMUS42]
MLSIFAGQMAEAAEGKAYPNGPRDLIGHYGNSPTQCQSYHRKSDNMTSISATSYEFCGGSMCGADIVSHRKLKDGYILNLKSPGNPSGRRVRVKLLYKGIQIAFSRRDPPETLARCTEADAIAGIGLRPDQEPDADKSLAPVFRSVLCTCRPRQMPGHRGERTGRGSDHRDRTIILDGVLAQRTKLATCDAGRDERHRPGTRSCRICSARRCRRDRRVLRRGSQRFRRRRSRQT